MLEVRVKRALPLCPVAVELTHFFSSSYVSLLVVSFGTSI